MWKPTCRAEQNRIWAFHSSSNHHLRKYKGYSETLGSIKLLIKMTTSCLGGQLLRKDISQRMVSFAGQGFFGGYRTHEEYLPDFFFPINPLVRHLSRSLVLSNRKLIRIQRKQGEMASISRVRLGCGIAPTT